MEKSRTHHWERYWDQKLELREAPTLSGQVGMNMEKLSIHRQESHWYGYGVNVCAGDSSGFHTV